MICYRDMTFCNAKCLNLTCSMKLTDKVKDDADRWWQAKGAPIAVSDFSDGCQSFISEERNNE